MEEVLHDMIDGQSLHIFSPAELDWFDLKYFLHSEMIIQMTLNGANLHQSKIGFHPIKFKKFAIQPNIINFSGSLASLQNINFEKKWSSQNWTKWGKSDELFIQIGIIFVKKASSIPFSCTFMTLVINFDEKKM